MQERKSEGQEEVAVVKNRIETEDDRSVQVAQQYAGHPPHLLHFGDHPPCGYYHQVDTFLQNDSVDRPYAGHCLGL